MIRKKVLDTYKKVVPPISQTEREALESGTVGWDGELFKGKPDWDKLLSLPEAKLTEKEQAFMDGPVQELCDKIDNWQLTTHDGGDLPDDIWEFIKDNKFLGMVIPEEYGGLGFSAYAHSEAVMKIASRSLTAAVTVMVPNSLGPAELLHEYGTQEQKDHYLPRLAKGQEIPCFALTGPDAGSDAGGMPDVGTVIKNEDGSLGIKINWDKRYITLGPVATLVGLAFKLEDPDGLLGGEKDLGITCALIPADTPGVDIGKRHRPMDLPFQNGPNSGKDVIVPIDSIIGGPENAGKGWKMLMESLSVGRSISLPAVSTAGAKHSTRITGAYSRVRRQFKTPIGKFEGVEEALARMAGMTYLMDAARTATVQMVDRGERPAIPSAIVKYHLTENMRKVVNDAMDINGGKAVMNGPNNLLADTYKGIPISITVEGANIMTRNLIIFGQGAVRAHPYMLKEMQAAEMSDEKAAAKELNSLLVQHIANGGANAGRSLWLGLTNGRTSKVPVKDKDMKRYYQQVNRLSAAFNVAANAALGSLGGELKRKERISARLGDVLSNLYLASTALRHYEMQGRKKEDLPLAKWAVEHSLHEAERSMHELLDNFPNKMTAGLLRTMIFPRTAIPFSGRYSNLAPSDKLEHEVAKLAIEPGEVRDRLTRGVYTTDKEGEPIAVLEDAFVKAVAAEAIEKKLYKAAKAGEFDGKDLADAVEKGIIAEEDVELLKAAEIARNAVVAVDDFEPDDYGKQAAKTGKKHREWLDKGQKTATAAANDDVKAETAAKSKRKRAPKKAGPKK